MALHRMVVARFEGQRFRIPSRVLSAPTILYPGVDWKNIDLQGALTRLGYQQQPGVARPDPGRYEWRSDRVRAHLRAFDHPSRPEPAHLVDLMLDGSEITEIRDVDTDRELGAVLLEPELVGAYYGPDREQREIVQIGDVPRHLIHAILAAEDQRFDAHHGIDPIRIAGAFLANLRHGSTVQGGSTVTQQLVKNFFLTPERTLQRKLREAAISVIVESRYSKDEIFECYLNEIYLGQRGATEVHGVGEASRLYFGKSVRELTVSESALLAAVIPGPNGISPYRAPDRALARRNLVLDLMHDQDRIDDATWEAAKAEPLQLSAVTPEPSEARYFLDALRRQLPEVYDSETLTSEGLRIYSTLDLRLQRTAARALREGLAELEQKHKRLRTDSPEKALQGCLVALRPQTGEVLALVGGRDYGASQFDRCTQARRQAGSTFKPFVYLAGLEPVAGGPRITLASRVQDEPLSIPTSSGTWSPANYDKQFHGPVSVRTALERSMNVATARLAQEVGIARVADLARRLGIDSRLPKVPSLALGVADLAPIELARAYATIANGGIRPVVTTFDDAVDRSGVALARRDIQFERVLDAGTAYLGTSLMEGVVDRGTATLIRRAGIEGPVAGKTGTTDDGRDAWFVGFTPELVIVVWVGFDQPRATGLTGAAGALPIWTRFLKDVTGGRVRGAFLPPPEVVDIEIEPGSGALALDGCPSHEPEYFLLGTEPTSTCPAGVFFRQPDPSDGGSADAGQRDPRRRRGGFVDWLKRVF
jgi:penicillin-binding protein 1B